ncbi:hypothetical protein A9X03_05820 [Mycobacterium sp. E1715]|nr:hypothetical protein A5703_12300 [Mycobacterium sp. E188]OBG73359.1 hypothetical protein A5701_24230 [Mycobacterium sp. E3305]OBG82990.1 hypothetical protein A9X05_18845 [Mycobacterium sp. E3298]OBH32766.1 hypothetical protein A9X03_05820 [Mycobacterium sp. E1715]OBH40923.1 hypothetical protein A5691_19880 [Mycobacterium sp. E183]
MRMLLALASFAAVIGAATPARADPAGNPDASFLAALDQAGVPYKDGAVAIRVGKKACALMDQGHSKAAVIQSVSSENAGFTVAEATSFTTSAVNAYCPQHIGEPDTVAPPPPTNTGMFPWIPFPPPGAA